MRAVHRPATEREKEAIPGAYTFNRASEQFHDRNGFPVAVPLELLSQLLPNRQGRKRKD